MKKYIKDSLEIEKQSFQIIKNETNLSRFGEKQKQIAMRLIHTCGNPEIEKFIRMSSRAIEKGVEALKSNSAILCDVEMVKQGLTKRFLTSEPLCFLNHKNVKKMANDNAETRTMSSISLWNPYLLGSITVIGNSPTALFRLIEMLENIKDKPSLIIGMPVGFVSADESKNFLWKNHKRLGVECITIIGRMGGSALAASALNSILRMKCGVI